MNQETIGQELEKANIYTEIARIKTNYGTLTVKDELDKVGFEAVTTARKEVKKFRVSVEKFAKSLREPALAFQKAVIAKEKEIVSQIEEVENYLTAQEEIYSPTPVVADTPMTDADRLASYKESLLKVKLPVMETEEGRTRLENLTRGLTNLLQ